MPDVVATVNGDRITMQELGAECLLRHGEEVLEGEISQLLLEQALEAADVTVTQQDLDAEMRHAAELAGVVDKQGKADLATWVGDRHRPSRASPRSSTCATRCGRRRRSRSSPPRR